MLNKEYHSFNEMKRLKIVFLTTLTKAQIQEKPSNFSYYVKDMLYDERLDIRLINPKDVICKSGVMGDLQLVRTINKINPDILYLTGLMGLNNIVVCRAFGLLHCRIFTWKYTFCATGRNKVVHFILKNIYWKNISRIYMAYDRHTEKALQDGIVKPNQIVTLSRGVEYQWYEKFIDKSAKNNDFTVVATGKDNRDYDTLCAACEKAQVKCYVYTRKHDSCLKAAKKFAKSKYCKIVFMEDLHVTDEYEYIMQQVGKANVLAICCTDVPYGVGYTNVVEGLPYCIPILITSNPNAHLDVEKEGIGYNIALYDIDDWAAKLKYLKEHPEVRTKMANNVERLIKSEWNDSVTSSFIINDMLKNKDL